LNVVEQKLDGIGGTEVVDVALDITTGEARYTSGSTWKNAYSQWGKGIVGGNVEIIYSGHSENNVNVPAIAFYDKDNNLLGKDGADGTAKNYENVKIVSPANTAYAIVNGTYNMSKGAPKLSYTKVNGVKDFIEKSAITNALKGKKIVCIGDSIVKGQGYDGGTKGNKSYVNIIAERNEMECINYAVSGATLCSGANDSVFHVCDNISTMDEDADYIVFGGGYNDHTYRTPLGSISEDYTTTLSTSAIKQIIGGAEKCCRELLSRYPNKKILFVFSHKINDTPYTPVNDWNGNGGTHTMTEVHDAIEKVLKKYSIPYVDLFNESRLNTAIADFKKYTANADGTHPTKEGYELFYCDAVENKLRSI
ncbi:MAG: SGNH/GDSL hydrolase family protein, partial [Bacteroidales bacterium]|nr:SGNH/GDSL hydrolase family protein [Candidatus Minthousia equi]